MYHTCFETLYVPPDVRLALQQMSVVERFQRVRLFVGAYDVALLRLHHQQRLAERARSLSEDVFRAHGDDGGEGEDEVVDVGGVEVVGGHRVGHRVGGHVRGSLDGEPQHILGVHLLRGQGRAG